MAERSAVAAEVQLLLDELCVDLGFCLPPDDQRRLRDTPPRDMDDFTDAVFRAEGLDPRLHKDLRIKVTDRVRRHMAHWHHISDGRRPE